jgi:predicted Zn-dependent protease with MMP-like domain
MSEDPASADSLLYRAAQLSGEGRCEDALELLERVPEDRGERWAVACDAWLEIGGLEWAEDALGRARKLLPPDDPDLVWQEARVHLARWQLDEARQGFARLDAKEEGAPLLENLAILADLEGDHERAHELLVLAHGAEPGQRPAPVRFEPEAFEELVSEAAEELPDEFRSAFEEIAVVIDPMPTAQLLGAPASGHPPDTLGLFVGLPFSERGSETSGEMPATIFLFQRNLERIVADVDELRDEIRTTLFHELGHALGFDEEGVDAMGLA